MIGFEIIYRSPAAIAPLKRADLTVVVPISNTAPYLQACLDSITAQGNLFLEIILVDFRSTDGGREMALDFARKSQNLSVIVADQTQGGLGGVRNFGIEIGTGRYVTFIDSDDLVAADIYPRMIDFSETHDCDIVFSKAVQFEQYTKVSYPSHATWSWDIFLGDKPYLIADVRQEPLILQIELTAANRVIRFDFIKKHNIICPPGIYYEDFPPHIKSIFLAKRIGLINTIGSFKRESRMGQMTGDRGTVSLNALDATEVAMKEIEAFQPDQKIGGAIASIFLRTANEGGGIRTYYKDRCAYYQKALAQFARFPLEWSTVAEALVENHFYLKTLNSAFAHQNMNLALSLACGNPSGFKILAHYLRHGEWKYVWQKRKEIAERMRAA